MKLIALSRSRIRPIATRIPSERSGKPQRQFRWWSLDIEPHKSMLCNLRDAAENARTKLRLQWSAYLKSTAEQEFVTPEAARTTQAIWKRLAIVNNIEPPNARPTEDKGLRLSWNRAGRYLEILVDSTGSFDWFYTDTNNQYDAGDDLNIGSELESLRTHVAALF